MAFSRTIGHEKQKELFLRAIKNNHLGHAFLLAGPEHIGKTTFALDLAEALFADPILDVTLLDAENGFTVEDARNLQSRLSLTPVGKLKVAVIASVERISLSVANLLLKTLEEPPRQSLIILTTANQHALLPTIVSRVQRVNFSRLSDEEVGRALEASGIEPAKVSAIVSFCAGRLGLGKRIVASPEMYDFFESARHQVTTLNSGTLLERLQGAEAASKYEENDLRKFLIFAMTRWTEVSGNSKLGAKLLQTWSDSRFNLNQKLLMDNLFLP